MTNIALAPFERQTAPVIAQQIRPFVRNAQPLGVRERKRFSAGAGPGLQSRLPSSEIARECRFI